MYHRIAIWKNNREIIAYAMNLKKLQEIILPVIKNDNMVGFCDCFINSEKSKRRKERQEFLSSIPVCVNFSIIDIPASACWNIKCTDSVHNYYSEVSNETIKTFMNVRYPSANSMVGLSGDQYDSFQELFVTELLEKY